MSPRTAKNPTAWSAAKASARISFTTVVHSSWLNPVLLCGGVHDVYCGGASEVWFPLALLQLPMLGPARAGSSVSEKFESGAFSCVQMSRIAPVRSSALR